jgi:hypothetical protein
MVRALLKQNLVKNSNNLLQQTLNLLDSLGLFVNSSSAPIHINLLLDFSSLNCSLEKKVSRSLVERSNLQYSCGTRSFILSPGQT